LPARQNLDQLNHEERGLFEVNLCDPRVVEGNDAIQMFVSDVLA
jgi:hypothetical protein